MKLWPVCNKMCTKLTSALYPFPYPEGQDYSISVGVSHFLGKTRYFFWGGMFLTTLQWRNYFRVTCKTADSTYDNQKNQRFFPHLPILPLLMGAVALVPTGARYLALLFAARLSLRLKPSLRPSPSSVSSGKAYGSFLTVRCSSSLLGGGWLALQLMCC